MSEKPTYEELEKRIQEFEQLESSQKLIEKAVEAEHKRFNYVLDTLPVYLIFLSPDCHVPFANRFFRDRFGESKGQRCFEYLFGRTEPCEPCETYTILKTMKPHQWEWLGPDGRWYDIYDMPFTDTDGSTLIMEMGIDITERKRTEEALRVSEKRYRSIIELNSAGYFLINLDGRFQEVNDAWLKMHGYSSSDEIIGKHFSITQVENNLEAAKNMVKSLIEGMSIPSGEFSRLCQDGSIGYHMFTANPVVKEGRLTGLEGFMIDITERKKAEEALRESGEKYRTLFEESFDGLFITSPGGRILDMNRKGVMMFGYDTKDEILSLDLERDVYAIPPDRKRILSLVNAQGSAEYDILVKKKSGQTMLTHCSLTAVKDEWGVITSYRGIIRDITEHRRTEDSLRESEEKYRALVENSMDAVFLSAQDGRVFAANKGACEMLGMSESEIVASGRNAIVDLNDPRLPAALKERAQTGRFSGELNFKKKDGAVFPVWISSTLFKDSHGDERTCIVAHDISERKKLEEELARVEKLESLGLLAGGIAHDFNNILTTILGNISLAGMLVKPEDEISELLNEAEKASIRAQMLTRQLLTFAKGGAPVKEIASISDIIKESSLFVLRGSKSRCEFSIKDDLWAAEIDVGQINQVINNIVLNARQAMPNGGIIRVAADNFIIEERSGLPVKPGTYIRITIADQGVGIAEKQLSNIFDPFFTTKQLGSGLGLTTTYSIIKKHDGHISVESRLGAGTTFYIYLPASDKIVPKKEDVHLMSGQGRILVMDDEAPLRKVVGKILEKLGYESDFAKDGAEAILLFKQAKESGKPYDAVILDLTVPGGMGGKETIKKLLEIDPEVKAIVSSGYSDAPVLADFRAYGFKAVMPKPFELRSLSKVLDEALKSKG